MDPRVQLRLARASTAASGPPSEINEEGQVSQLHIGPLPDMWYLLQPAWRRAAAERSAVAMVGCPALGPSAAGMPVAAEVTSTGPGH